MNARLRRFLRDFTTPAMVRAIRGVLDSVRPAPFEFLGYEWPAAGTFRGWNGEGVQKNREATWNDFVKSVEGTRLLGLAESDLRFPYSLNLDDQAFRTTFGYSLALAARERDEVSVLDWGGSSGNYYVIARRLLPDAKIRYTVVDLPAACALGRRVLPEVTFDEGTAWQRSSYDFVFSSSSLQYLEDWRSTTAALADATRRFLYITRMPFITEGRSFVALQRVREYETEYPGWVLNDGEFVRLVESRGLRRRLDFVNHVGPPIKGAPSQNFYRGYLFER